MYETIHSYFEMGIHYVILLMEAVGSILIVWNAVRSLFHLLRHEHERSHVALTDGIITGLNYLLCSEVLKTIVAPDWESIGMTCAVLLMRAAITLLVRWENKQDPPKAPAKAAAEKKDEKA